LTSGDKIFGQLDIILELGEGHLGLDHPELGKMSGGVGFSA
jgi:hypothetical protein